MAANPHLLPLWGEAPVAGSRAPARLASGAFRSAFPGAEDQAELEGGGAVLSGASERSACLPPRPSDTEALVLRAERLREDIFSVRVAGRYRAELISACLFMRHGARTPKDSLGVAAPGGSTSASPPAHRGGSPCPGSAGGAECDAAKSDTAKSAVAAAAAGPATEEAPNGENGVQSATQTHAKPGERGLEICGPAGGKPVSVGCTTASSVSASLVGAVDFDLASLASDGSNSGREGLLGVLPAPAPAPSGGAAETPCGALEAGKTSRATCGSASGDATVASSAGLGGGELDPTAGHATEAGTHRGGGRGRTSRRRRWSSKKSCDLPSAQKNPGPSSAGVSRRARASTWATFSRSPAERAVSVRLHVRQQREKTESGGRGGAPFAPSFGVARFAEGLNARQVRGGASEEAEGARDRTRDARGVCAPHSVDAGVRTPAAACTSAAFGDAALASAPAIFSPSRSTLLFPPSSPDPPSTASSASFTPSSRSPSSSRAETAPRTDPSAASRSCLSASAATDTGRRLLAVFSELPRKERSGNASEAFFSALPPASTPAAPAAAASGEGVVLTPHAASLPLVPCSKGPCPGRLPAPTALTSPPTGGGAAAFTADPWPFGCAPGLLTAAGWQQAACIGCSLRRRQRVILRNAFLRERLVALETREAEIRRRQRRQAAKEAANLASKTASDGATSRGGGCVTLGAFRGTQRRKRGEAKAEGGVQARTRIVRRKDREDAPPAPSPLDSCTNDPGVRLFASSHEAPQSLAFSAPSSGTVSRGPAAASSFCTTSSFAVADPSFLSHSAAGVEGRSSDSGVAPAASFPSVCLSPSHQPVCVGAPQVSSLASTRAAPSQGVARLSVASPRAGGLYPSLSGGVAGGDAHSLSSSRSDCSFSSSCSSTDSEAGSTRGGAAYAYHCRRLSSSSSTFASSSFSSALCSPSWPSSSYGSRSPSGAGTRRCAEAAPLGAGVGAPPSASGARAAISHPPSASCSVSLSGKRPASSLARFSPSRGGAGGFAAAEETSGAPLQPSFLIRETQDGEEFLLNRRASLFLCSTESLRCQQTAEGVLAGLLYGPSILRQLQRHCCACAWGGDRSSCAHPKGSCRRGARASVPEARGGESPGAAVEGRGGVGLDGDAAGGTQEQGDGGAVSEIKEKAAEKSEKMTHARAQECWLRGDKSERSFPAHTRAGFPVLSRLPSTTWPSARTAFPCLHVASSGSPLALALKAKSQTLHTESELLRRLTGWEEKAGLKVMKKFVSAYGSYLFHGVPPPPLTAGAFRFAPGPAVFDAPTTASVATSYGDVSRQSSALFVSSEESRALSSPPSPPPSQPSASLKQPDDGTLLTPPAEEREARRQDRAEARGARWPAGLAGSGSHDLLAASLGDEALVPCEGGEDARAISEASRGHNEEGDAFSASLLQAIFLGADVVTRLQFGEEEEVGWRAGGTSLLELVGRLEQMADWCLACEGEGDARKAPAPLPSAACTPPCRGKIEAEGRGGESEEAERCRAEEARPAPPPLLQIFVTHQSALLALQGALGVQTPDLHVPPFGCYILAELLRLAPACRAEGQDDASSVASEDIEEATGVPSDDEIEMPEEAREGDGGEDAGLAGEDERENGETAGVSCGSIPSTRGESAVAALKRRPVSLGSPSSVSAESENDPSTSSSLSPSSSSRGEPQEAPPGQVPQEGLPSSLSSAPPSPSASTATSSSSAARSFAPDPRLERLTGVKPKVERRRHPGCLVRWTINGSCPLILPPTLRFVPAETGSPTAASCPSSPPLAASPAPLLLTRRAEGANAEGGEIVSKTAEFAREESDAKAAEGEILASRLQQTLQERGEKLRALQLSAAATEYAAADAQVWSVLAEEKKSFPCRSRSQLHLRLGLAEEEKAEEDEAASCGVDQNGCRALRGSTPEGLREDPSQTAPVEAWELTHLLCGRRMPCFCFHCLRRAESDLARGRKCGEKAGLEETEPKRPPPAEVKKEGAEGQEATWNSDARELSRAARAEGGYGAKSREKAGGEESRFREDELDFETRNLVEFDRLLAFLDERIAKYGMPLPVGDGLGRQQEPSLQGLTSSGKGEEGRKKKGGK
ncbi:hypothetical protein BESB_013370 [Besnoitia besnoiti]|uniref:Uncharacterized protein n=1 Tax=Besnoitia besnoiti TaxID=94643 RepID=A0A2A9M434_BESBE|nr:hypothetical protein BESB_013370 [Besnoitia besnoiti]PFH32725.1 hypothetical protein BESB_013370 [Besnoitia besnoiti]